MPIGAGLARLLDPYGTQFDVCFTVSLLHASVLTIFSSMLAHTRSVAKRVLTRKEVHPDERSRTLPRYSDTDGQLWSFPCSADI